MKKIKLFSLMMLAVLVLPITAHAASINISCGDGKVKAGDTINCVVKGQSDAGVTVTEIEATLDFPSSLTAQTFTPDGWEGNSIANGKIEVYGDGATGSFNIGTLSVKVNDSFSGSAVITLKNVIYYNSTDSDGKEVPNSSTTLTENVSHYLKSLTVTNGTLLPNFDATKTGYVIALATETTSFGINAVADNNSDTVVITNGHTGTTITDPSNIIFETSGGNKSMLLKIVVGDKVEYTIGVSRPTGELASLTIGGKSIPLVSGQTNYTVTLSSITSFEINATLKDPDNFEFQNLTFPTTWSSSASATSNVVRIVTRAKGDYSKTMEYNITVNKASSNGGNNGGGNNDDGNNGGGIIINPKTGGSVAIVMGIVLIISFGATIFFYKRNMSQL